MQEKDSQLQQREKELEDELKSAESLFSEANKRLASALKGKDYSEASIAQGLLEIANEKLSKAAENLRSCRQHRKNSGSRKHKLLDAAIVHGKKPKS